MAVLVTSVIYSNIEIKQKQICVTGAANLNNKKDRTAVNIPNKMLEEIDRILQKFSFYGNRQQFIESAVREKIEKVRLIEAGLPHEAEPHP
jgi:hypothetical protein